MLGVPKPPSEKAVKCSNLGPPAGWLPTFAEVSLAHYAGDRRSI